VLDCYSSIGFTPRRPKAPTKKTSSHATDLIATNFGTYML